MAVLKILIFPDQRLRTVAKDVLEINDEVKKLSSDLLETMYKGNGIGLSATQVNVHKKIVVIDVSEEKNSPLFLINPKVEILDPEEKIHSEGFVPQNTSKKFRLRRAKKTCCFFN